ncbi:FAD-dependent oxidoreductase [Gordonibacter urolithinfaciens]|uniref:SidA/IucD/PvdA family monooxygenase n=1 Tax=Gordonibacter urolithinfaciens TaxID=1335613 RepID=A0A6N8IK17_9ACTN|nr:FAD-dependent oxidoreductase [Gordonibacter urolithinfaciens]MVM53862.1 SidA/IucD/PvdA family monooxygenase [Gordonibacter urolithinfaciens]MVN15750.1 SidA/IucD/PvdA family monooxygenase [Gordonibacter urolithinfaciens]MVN39317.1 SidA/IucD/PvdA family monooxygenase [Gordonibacter urolithinfaciens]MVN54870.1 SidA/IucD/PvdA family monooxygenase [Gordonibacter urolithinfaciens]MVN60226.1 SidA/IucD/PvdA family monooxygenase [Gordonibacter urolithinfaciens]
MRRVDAAVIGFGKGGKTLASALAAAGKTVALVEKSPKMYGGTCINVACIPTKSLVHSAALSAAQGGTFSERAARYATAIDEKDRVTGLLRSKNYRKLADLPNVEVVDGAASFADATHLTVAKPDGTRETIEAAQAFINTGARPFVPPIPGVDGPRVHVSETLLDVRTLPERLVIIGGGYIGMEFASMYANFGSQVTVVQNEDAFLPREDAEIAAAVLDSVEGRGIRVIRGAGVRRIDDEADQAVVTVEISGAEERLPADAVLVATGRRPNVDGLNLEAAGAELTERGAVRTNEHLRTTAPNIWALGDVAGGLQFTYISLDDSRIVKEDVLGDGARTTANRGTVPYSVFLDPPFSRAGMTEQEARDAGFDVKVAKLPAAAIPKAQLLQKSTGLLKAVVNADTGRILGAHLFCEESYEMINTVKLAMDAGLPYQVLRDAVYTHPTMSEAFNDLFAQVR